MNSQKVGRNTLIHMYIAKSHSVGFLLASGGKCVGLTVAKTCRQEDVIQSKG